TSNTPPMSARSSDVLSFTGERFIALMPFTGWLINKVIRPPIAAGGKESK
ncbi:hypothetical protein MGSAQ_000875, partial [marine sediment metagenome]